MWAAPPQLLALLALPLALHGQAGSRVIGVVIDRETGKPLPEAWVTVVGSDAWAASDPGGRFLLDAIGPGAISLRVQRDGYSTSVEEVEVPAEETLTLLIDLVPMGVLLDGVLLRASTGKQGGRGARKAEEPAETAASVQELIVREVPGDVLQRTGGQAGSEVQLRIRGFKTLTLGTDPVVYIDGIRVSPLGLDPVAARSVTSRILDQVDPSDVEDIQVLRGPAAAVEYPDAVNGVVIITTKKGIWHRPR